MSDRVIRLSDGMIAEEQQMKAKVAENRSQLVLAEAEVPMAMAEAFRKTLATGRTFSCVSQ